MHPLTTLPRVALIPRTLAAFALSFLVLPSQPALGKTVTCFGEVIYDYRTTTGNEACKKALEKAKRKAIVEVAGEIVSGEQLLRCDESDGEDQCNLHSSTWSSLRGKITGLTEIDRKIQQSQKDFAKCRVEIKAEVQPFSGNRDPSLDFNVDLNSSSQVYREGENIRFSVKPLQPLYLNIFLWDPYEKSDKKVVKIFPNQFDMENLVKAHLQLPRENKFETNVVGAPAGRKSIEQFLMFVGTRNKIDFLDSYRVSDLNKRLLEIPIADWREKRRGFLVIRGSKR